MTQERKIIRAEIGDLRAAIALPRQHSAAQPKQARGQEMELLGTQIKVKSPILKITKK